MLCPHHLHALLYPVPLAPQVPPHRSRFELRRVHPCRIEPLLLLRCIPKPCVPFGRPEHHRARVRLECICHHSPINAETAVWPRTAVPLFLRYELSAVPPELQLRSAVFPRDAPGLARTHRETPPAIHRQGSSSNPIHGFRCDQGRPCKPYPGRSAGRTSPPTLQMGSADGADRSTQWRWAPGIHDRRSTPSFRRFSLRSQIAEHSLLGDGAL